MWLNIRGFLNDITVDRGRLIERRRGRKIRRIHDAISTSRFRGVQSLVGPAKKFGARQPVLGRRRDAD